VSALRQVVESGSYRPAAGQVADAIFEHWCSLRPEGRLSCEAWSMAMASSDLSVRLNVEQAVPVEATPATQGKASGKDGQGEPRRRLPPSEECSDEKSSTNWRRARTIHRSAALTAWLDRADKLKCNPMAALLIRASMTVCNCR